MPPPDRPSLPISVADLAARLGASVEGPGNLPLTHLDSVHRAGPGALTFIRSAAYAPAWAQCRASAAIVTRGLEVRAREAPPGALLVVPDADAAMIVALPLFALPKATAAPGIHPAAHVDPTARIGRGVSIGPGCSVGAGAEIGDGAVLHANVVLGPLARLGPGTILHAGVTVLERCSIGAFCTLWPGVIIGTDGFGYHPAPDGKGLLKIPHIGTVEIGDAVEIGANSCIDRAKFGATIIGSGTKIDNLVQIGHNCIVGRACIICGNTGLSGSVELGDGVILAGSVRVADNLRIGARARLAGGAGAMNDVPAGETWWGTPASPFRQEARNVKAYNRLADDIKRLDQLEEQVQRLLAAHAAPEPPAAAPECSRAGIAASATPA